MCGCHVSFRPHAPRTRESPAAFPTAPTGRRTRPSPQRLTGRSAIECMHRNSGSRCLDAAASGRSVRSLPARSSPEAESPRLSDEGWALLGAIAGLCVGGGTRAFLWSLSVASRLVDTMFWGWFRPTFLLPVALPLCVWLIRAFAPRSWPRRSPSRPGAAAASSRLSPLFFIGATSGSALAVATGVAPPVGAAFGLVSVLAAAANTPIAAAVMGMELLPHQLGVYESSRDPHPEGQPHRYRSRPARHTAEAREPTPEADALTWRRERPCPPRPAGGRRGPFAEEFPRNAAERRSPDVPGSNRSSAPPGVRASGHPPCR